MNARVFDGTAFPPLGDFTGREICNPATGKLVAGQPYASAGASLPVTPAPLPGWLRSAAASEW